MAILKIARMGNPILRQRSQAVEVSAIPSAQIQTLIDGLIETMRDYDGAGLAAPQVHVGLRIVVFEVINNPRYPDAPEIPLTVAINPQIEPLTESTFGMWEGCLSVPEIRGYVERSASIKFSALDRQGKPFSQKLDGFPAVVVQHECDHLDGKLFIDRVRDTTKLAFLKEYQKFHVE
ncbi:MAG: peptide deformylase [Spirulina sp. SIO3F2]|nr:peptide deformylase [Spirulina sp. SIO3F2]